jgi:hypothetical protein
MRGGGQKFTFPLRAGFTFEAYRLNLLFGRYAAAS